MFLSVFLYFSIIVFAKCVNTQQEFYTAAVVEYASQSMDDPERTMLKNLEFYRRFTEEARLKNANIIVFPEYGLTTVDLENPELYAIEVPSNQNFESNKVLKELHDIALEHGIYVVANLIEKTTDNNNKTQYYNTNLVFDKYGSLIAKYRKMNLYLEDKLTPGNETVVFTTDFGVTFSIFTCADILFQNPSVEVLKNNRVTDIIFPTAWFSTLPFMASPTVQHGYVMSHQVNLLAADYNNPGTGNGGSGIYLADGTIGDFIFMGTHSSKLLTYSVPIRVRRPHIRGRCNRSTPKNLLGALPNDKPDIQNFKFSNISLAKYQFKSIDLDNVELGKNTSYEICHNSFCCNFNISFEYINNLDIYKLAAYDGPVEVGDVQFSTRVCSLVSCANKDDPNSCTAITNPISRIGSVTVDGVLPNQNRTFYRPTTLLSNLKPIEHYEFCHHSNDNWETSNVHAGVTNAPIDNLIVFGIVGISSSATIIQLSLIPLILVITKIFLL